MARNVVLLVVLTCLAVAGCSVQVDGRPRAAGEETAAGGSAAPAGEPEKLPRPKDRDLQAVTVALRKLDACGVFDLGAARAAGNPAAAVLPSGPHSCYLVPKANYSPGDDPVELTVGDGQIDLYRYMGAPVRLAGVDAYEYRESRACQLHVPVSFTRSLRFRLAASDACPVVRQVAEASVARLRNPDAITVDPGTRPFAAWDGCVFLAQLLGEDAGRYTFEPDGIRDPFSGCQTAEKRDEQSAPKDKPKDKKAGEVSRSPDLEVSYDQVPGAPKQSRQVGGKTVDVGDFGTGCVLTWNQGPSGVGSQWFAAQIFRLGAPDCDSAARLAEQAMLLAGQQPADAAAAPQRPLLYNPDEPQSPSVGACVDFSVPRSELDCEPYHETSVPRGADQIMAAASANRNVQCAVFGDAVKAQLGPTFQAMTWGAHCFFVESGHTLQIQVNVDADNAPGDYGDRPDLWVDRRETTVEGLPAISFWDKSRSVFDLYLSPHGDLSRKGNLHIQVEARGGRGNGDGPPQTKLDPAKAEAATKVMTDVVRRHFKG
ncbi:hypothetical protein [Actinophytocola sp.]|uniref:hypothetical protein n=1 Tax=Actinophytocola sp. TaxID=1872138 RepID=UPI002D80D03B|nr:hypothetical protein [Actinophytocola sp.]HET9141794.1 hypothetical protein [Actinophytocola sp.]